MWGNQRGWIFAAIIALGMGALLGFAVIPPGITRPTGTLTLAMKPAVFTTDPNTIVPAPTGDQDAGPIYLKAGNDWSDHQTVYEEMTKNITDTSKNVPEAVKDIISASDCGKMALFTNDLDDVINYRNQRPTLEGLYNGGELLNSLALLYTTDHYKKPKLAVKYATAEFNLGRHLYEERIIFAEWMDGLNLMANAAIVLSKTQSDSEKATADKDFGFGINDFLKGPVQKLWQIISGIDDQETATYAGDIFQIARESPERMWRVEATLKLGRFRYNAATKGDQIGARHVLRAMSAAPTLSTDPLTQTTVHAAALAAANLSIEDYRNQ
jgi:hypothetical protein